MASTTSSAPSLGKKGPLPPPPKRILNNNQWCLTRNGTTCVSDKVFSVQVSAPSSTVKPFLQALIDSGEDIRDFIRKNGNNYIFSSEVENHGGKSINGLTVEEVDDGNNIIFSHPSIKERIGPVSMNEIVPIPKKRGGRRRRKSRKSLFKKKRTKKRKRRRRRKSKRKSLKRRKKTRRRRK